MEQEVALNLLLRFLEKRGVDSGTVKQVPGLIAYGRATGSFAQTGSLFDESEWQRLGETLWDHVIDDKKDAKKLMKPWREVINCIRKHKIEKDMAAAASRQLGGVPEDAGLFKPGVPYVSPPSTGMTVRVRSAVASPSINTSEGPSAPPPEDSGGDLPDLFPPGDGGGNPPPTASSGSWSANR